MRRKVCCVSSTEELWRAREIPGIVRDTVDFVEGLAIHEKFRDVGSTEEDCTGILESANRYRIGCGPRILKLRHAPSTRLAAYTETFLDVDRNAMKDASRGVACDGLVGLFGGVERLVAQLIDVDIELRLKGVDAT